MEPLILSVSHWRTFRVESRQRVFPPPPASLPRRRVHLWRQSAPLAACVQCLRNSRDYLSGFSCNLCRCNILIKHSGSLCSPTRVGALIEMFLLTFGPTVSLSFFGFACLNLQSYVVIFIHKSPRENKQTWQTVTQRLEKKGAMGRLLVRIPRKDRGSGHYCLALCFLYVQWLWEGCWFESPERVGEVATSAQHQFLYVQLD